MITQILLQNVRIFENKEWIFPLSPISVFCGTNNSGKSTILKSLLLLKQTEGINESYMLGRGRLRFNGSQVDLGNFKTFVSHEDISKKMVIGITIKDSISRNNINKIKGFSVETENDLEKNDDKENIDYYLDAKFTFSTITQTAKSKKNENVPADQINQPEGVLEKAEYKAYESNNNQLLSWSVNLRRQEGKNYYSLQIPKAFFLNAFKEIIPQIEKEVPDLFETRIKNKRKSPSFRLDDEFVEFRTSVFGLLPTKIEIIRNQNIKEKSKSKSILHIELPLPPAIDKFQRDFHFSLDSIKYLGPLRTPAKRYYVTPLEITPPMDPAGEFLPYVFRELSQGKKIPISYFPPGDLKEKKNTPLLFAVNDWLHYIRTGIINNNDDFENEIEYEQTKVLLEFKIRGVIGQERHALADSGFGYSQILPIIIRGLISKPDDIIVIEQPELHLNPALQTRLSEFLVSLVKAKKQIILETHSEHIVNMIRVLVAEDINNLLYQLNRIYYIDNLYEKPNVHELSINNTGMVPKWPHSFFGEAATLSGRLLRAQKIKK
jgi:predicted ATPase